jgi:hypothetical protein
MCRRWGRSVLDLSILKNDRLMIWENDGQLSRLSPEN